jgi:pimeloyl-ACP methyl ester carboxylesterase
MSAFFPELPRRTVDALGIATSYYTAGRPEATPVILLHGMSTSGDSFRELMVELAAERRLIAPDLPGFGFSAHTSPYTIPHLVEWLAAFADALGLTTFYLLGHSFGGIVATSYALAYPEDIAGLILVAPAVMVAGNYPEWLRKAGKSLKLVEIGVRASRLFLQRQLRVPFYDPQRQHDSVWERRLADYRRSRASADAMNAAAFHDLRPRLKEISQATALIWGANDPVVAPTDAPAVARLMPQAQLHLLPACGHAPMLEQRAEVASIVRSFVP